MKIGWMYPHREQCGIARYAHDYAHALLPHAEIVDIDPQWWIDRRSLFSETVSVCDIVHLQYDTAAYMRRRRDFLGDIATPVRVPVIVSLHEVYEEDPAVFPRSRIGGGFPLLQLKRALWDYRHPVQRAFIRNCARSFFARIVLVHHRYHAGIITGKGCMPRLVRVVPLPVKRCSVRQKTVSTGLPILRLGAFGFINPLFDYDLLFAALKALQRPWTFTWIGGIRNTQQQPLLDMVVRRINAENWSDRFRITGWIPEEGLPSIFEDVDVVCAFFSDRSSSASISRALGAAKVVIATSIPLTREIVADSQSAGAPPPLLLTEGNAAAVVAAIEEVFENGNLRTELLRGASAYCTTFSFEAMAQRLMAIYRELLAA